MYEKLKLTPGLLTLRLVKPQSGEINAVVRPIVPVASRHAIRLMFQPGNVAGSLTQVDELCVIWCGQPAVIVLEINAAHGDGTANGSVELDYLATTAPEAVAGPAMDMTVYLDRLGDKSAPFGTWVGADEPGHPIAGVMLHPRTNRPRIMLRDLASGQIAAPGEYLGSTAGFRPLCEFQAWIDGPDDRHRLHVLAEFSLAGRVEAYGTLVTLHGAGPDDRLVRLNLQLKPFEATAGNADPSQPKPKRRDRVRIFRKT